MNILRKQYRKTVPEVTRLKIRGWLNDLRGQEAYFKQSELPADLIHSYGERLLALKGQYAGNRCFIMGNGPSLNKMDLNKLSNEYVWGSNRCYLLFQQINWRPSFYIAVDKRVVPDTRLDILRLIDAYSEMKFFFPAIFSLDDTLVTQAENVYWYNEIDMYPTLNPANHFSQHVDKWVSAVRTVTVAALQFAVYLGFNPIYLIGCDTTYTIPASVALENQDSDKLISTADDDPNHFSGAYFGTGSKWHDPHVDRMITHYKEAKTVCDSMRVEVLNATVGGALEVFPRANYQDIF